MEIFTLIILFALCAILLAIELFVFPGISIAGIAAACCLVGANYVAFSWFGLTTGLWACAASIVACGLLGYWLMHSKTLEKYSLHKSIDSTAASADIGGRTVEVKSADGFLDEGTPVVVVRVEDAQITVKKK